ncbi:hypothetical protein V2J09_016270 [Rumex salicifolius]
MESNRLWFSLVVVFVSLAASAARSDDCVYTIYVRTGSIIKGGTDSKIGVELYDEFGGTAEILDLEAWGGLMGSGYDYFERGNLDIFSGRGRCLGGSVCAIRLSSDGSGPHAGWYCNYVELTSTGPHTQCSQQQFTVEQWLAVDAPPYELAAVRNYCSYDAAGRLPLIHPLLPLKSAPSSSI